jgi:hypothetical protein
VGPVGQPSLDTHHRRPACPTLTVLGCGGRRWSMSRKQKRPQTQKRPKFTGKLNEPIVSKALALLPKLDLSDQERQELNELVKKDLEQQWMQKLELLLDHYKVQRDKDQWRILSFRLAWDFVPGMKVVTEPVKKGRPGEWKGVKGLRLFYEVELIKNERKRGERDAIHILITRHPDEWGMYKGKKERQLVSRYSEVKSYFGGNAILKLMSPEKLLNWLQPEGKHGK